MYLLVCLCLPGRLAEGPAWSRIVFQIYGGLAGSLLEEREKWRQDSESEWKHVRSC